MSIYKDGKLIAGGSQALPLLSFIWSDHILNHPSWLRADTFSWQPGLVYIATYQHLADDIDGKTLQSETISGTTVQFYLADDGHKICPASEEGNVAAIYNATGVAWYYILDTVNQRFKLPRDNSKKDRVLIKTITSGSNWARIYADGWVEQGGTLSAAVNPTANFSITMADTDYHILLTGLDEYAGERRIRFYVITKNTSSMVIRNTNSDNAAPGVPTYWEVKGYGNTTVLQNVSTEFAAEYKYLYFYVGQFTQTALENTAGLNASLFNGKADIDLTNVSSAGKAESVSWGRNFTVVDSTVATGTASIAGIYGLGFTDNKVKIGVFAGAVLLTQAGFSSIALSSDVMTTATRICGTNNQFRSDGTITIPFINEIRISFPETGGGVANGSFVKFIGYM